MCASVRALVVLAAPVAFFLVTLPLAPLVCANDGLDFVGSEAVGDQNPSRSANGNLKVTIGLDAPGAHHHSHGRWHLAGLRAQQANAIETPSVKNLMRRGDTAEGNAGGREGIDPAPRSFLELKQELVGDETEGNSSSMIGGAWLTLVRSPDLFISDPFVTYALKFMLAQDFDIEQDQVALGLDKVGAEVFESDGSKRAMIKVRYCTIYPSGEGRNSTAMVETMTNGSPERISNGLFQVLDYLQANYTPEVTFIGAMNGCENDLQAGDEVNGASIAS